MSADLQLLKKFMSPKQIEQAKHYYFYARGSQTNHRYRIYCLRKSHMFAVVNEDTNYYYCSINRQLPFYDVVLIQKLLIENDEHTFLGNANACPFHPHYTIQTWERQIHSFLRAFQGDF